MAKFIKKVSGQLDSGQKAAVLAGEIGREGLEKVIPYLSTEELKKLRKKMKDLGNWVDISAENYVLEDCLRFGMVQGYVPHDEIARAELNASNAAAQENVLGRTNINSADLAKVISMWMREE